MNLRKKFVASGAVLAGAGLAAGFNAASGSTASASVASPQRNATTFGRVDNGPSTLCTATDGRFSVVRVASDTYYVMPNEWGSSAPLCVSTTGGANFKIASSRINQSSVGAYPDIATIGRQNGLPVQISHMGDPRSSWSTLTPGPDSKYNVAYDLTIGTSATSTGWAGGAEVMIWLKSHGNPYPAGPVVASRVWIDGYAYAVHVKPNPGGTGHVVVSFIRERQTRSVTNMNLGRFVRSAAKYGSFPTSYYLLGVQAGFEIWKGGAGLETTHYSYQPGAVAAARR